MNFLEIENKYSSSNFERLPIVTSYGKGIFLFDINHKKYFDFISGYTCVNFGHSHPRLISCAIKQIKKISLPSRTLYNDTVSEFVEVICNRLQYDKVITMNSGTEACETAIKLSRKYAYEIKGIPPNKAKIIVMQNNFMGRAFGTISGSTDYLSYNNFGPLLEGFISIPFNNLTSLISIIQDPNICALFIEPIQGHAGIIIPEKGYLTQVSKLCKENNVLLVVDEIQTGIGRTGKFLACEYEAVKPDILLLGKALTGGISALSVILGSAEVIDLLKPGMHGSTYGGNPLSCAIAIEALNILEDEDLINNSKSIGHYFRNEMSKFGCDSIQEIRGRGLLNAIKFHHDINTRDICLALCSNQILVSRISDNSIRFTPPLTITYKQMKDALNMIFETLIQLRL